MSFWASRDLKVTLKTPPQPSSQPHPRHHPRGQLLIGHRQGARIAGHANLLESARATSPGRMPRASQVYPARFSTVAFGGYACCAAGTTQLPPKRRGPPAPYGASAESRAICSLASTAGSLNRAKGLIGSPPSRQLAASTWEGATPRRRAHAVSAIAIQTRGCRLLACLPVYSSITHSASPRMTSAECDVSYEAPGAGSLRDSSVVRLPCSQEVRAVWWR